MHFHCLVTTTMTEYFVKCKKEIEQIYNDYEVKI